MEQNKITSTKNGKLDEYFKLITHLVNSGFYGEVLCKLEKGNIVIVKKTESIKLNEK